MMETKKVAIICLTIYGITCLYFGIDHFIIFTIASLIAGIAGYEIKKWRA